MQQVGRLPAEAAWVGLFARGGSADPGKPAWHPSPLLPCAQLYGANTTLADRVSEISAHLDAAKEEARRSRCNEAAAQKVRQARREGPGGSQGGQHSPVALKHKLA